MIAAPNATPITIVAVRNTSPWASTTIDRLPAPPRAGMSSAKMTLQARQMANAAPCLPGLQKSRRLPGSGEFSRPASACRLVFVLPK
jgi:hypothetical protein